MARLSPNTHTTDLACAGTRSILDFFPKAEPSTSGAAGNSTGGAPSPPPAPDQARSTPAASPGARRIDDAPSTKRRLLAEAAERRLAALQGDVSFPAAARQLPASAGGSSREAASGGAPADATSLLDKEDRGRGRGGEGLRPSGSHSQRLLGGISAGAAAEQVGERVKQEQGGVRQNGSSISHDDVAGGLWDSSGACAVDLTGDDEEAAQPDRPWHSVVL